MPETSPSVLIIRLDAIGDALALTPLLAALRARGIPADLVLCDVNARIFSSRAARTIYEAPFALRSSTRENRAMITAYGDNLRAHCYTHVLVATEDPGGYRLASAVAAPTRVGFVNGWGKPLKTVWARAHLTQTLYRTAGLDGRAPHECAVLFRLAAQLLGGGATPTHDVTQLRPLVLESEPSPDARALFQVSDKWERLGIALHEVVATFERLRTIVAMRPIAAHREVAYAERFAAATGVAVEMCESLATWKSAIGAARAVVAPDSGAIHVAGMVGTPVVAVFPPSRHAALQTARWAPWAAPHRLVQAAGAWSHEAVRAVLQLLG